MTILVIDGQGGGLGREIVAQIKRKKPEATVVAVGTNSTATSAMLRAGADKSATGENPVRVLAKEADYIVGPVGIVVADSMMGEITEGIALAVARSRARRILVPMTQCDTIIAGVTQKSREALIESLIGEIK